MNNILRSYIRKVLLESPFDVAPGNKYPRTFEKFMQMVSQHQNDLWVFFDTETTGLYYNEREIQATEVAAVAFNMNGFLRKPTPVPDGTFHMKIALAPDTIEFMENEPERYEDKRKLTIKQILVMSQYDEGEVVKSQPEEVALEFTDYINDMKAIALAQGGKVRLIAQNAVFDIGIMNTLYSRSNIPVPDDIVWDTKAVFSGYLNNILYFLRDKSRFPLGEEDKKILSTLQKEGDWGPYISSSLGDLVTAFDISGGENWHSAIADVALTMKALWAVVQYLKKKGHFIQRLQTKKEFDPRSGDPYNRRDKK